MVRSRNDVLLRAVEATLGAAVVAALLVALTGGWLGAGAQTFADWYASKVDGLLHIIVVSTTVKLPQMERADLPLPQRSSPGRFATDDGTGATSSTGGDTASSAARESSAAP